MKFAVIMRMSSYSRLRCRSLSPRRISAGARSKRTYYSALALQDFLSAAGPAWVFKGGTCLSKVHSDFYRMSEDLDFAFSVPVDASRPQRSKTAERMKGHLANLPKRIPCFRVLESLQGYNNSTQYVGQLCYSSLITGQDEAVKVEFSIREPILEPVEHLPARTLLIDPFKQTPALEPLAIPVLSCRETYAEKIRAALTRRDPAIRDFYDVDHAIRTERIDVQDPRLLQLVQAKLSIPGNGPVDTSESKLNLLTRQTQTQLKPVLREAEYAAFDLQRAFVALLQLASKIIEAEDGG